jgi:hypothetical protein
MVHSLLAIEPNGAVGQGARQGDLDHDAIRRTRHLVVCAA